MVPLFSSDVRAWLFVSVVTQTENFDKSIFSVSSLVSSLSTLEHV